LAVCLGLAVAACDVGVGQGIAVANYTTVTVVIESTGIDGNVHRLGLPIPPGNSAALITGSLLQPDSLVAKDGCIVSDLVARDPGGREIGRRSPPLCVPETWVIQSAVPSG
jgi:hypothetical protein